MHVQRTRIEEQRTITDKIDTMKNSFQMYVIHLK